jgi:hypothetical protein
MFLEIHPIEEDKMAYTLDTKVGEILKDPNAVQIFERYAPGVSKNPMIGLAKGMSLKTLVSMPQAKQAGITEEMILKVLGEINAKK